MIFFVSMESYCDSHCLANWSDQLFNDCEVLYDIIYLVFLNIYLSNFN
jgi:hypothetical protein